MSERLYVQIEVLTQKLAQAEAQVRDLSTDVSGAIGATAGAAIVERMEQALTRSMHSVSTSPLTVTAIVVDLNNLKSVNDSFGHAAGDEFIRRAACALTSAFNRSGDYVIRTGGDEFLVLLDDGGSGFDWAKGTAQDALASAGISAAVGAASTTFYHSVDSTIAAADARMYMDKAEQRRMADGESA